MVRVAFIHPDLGIGGAERLVIDAAMALRSRGHEVELYTFRTNLVLISELRLFWKMSAKRKSSRASDLAAKKATCITFDLEWKSEGELKLT